MHKIKSMSGRVFPVVRKSKYGNYYSGNLMVDGQYVPGLTATGKNKQECSERLILAWSRRMAQDAHIAALKAENQPTEDKPVVEGMIEPIEPTQQNDIIEISEEGNTM